MSNTYITEESTKKHEPKKPIWYKDSEPEKQKEENRYIGKSENSFLEDEDTLTTYYNKIKGEDPSDGAGSTGQSKTAYRDRINYDIQVEDNVNKLKDNCCHQIILNLYMKANPMDDDYKHHHYHQMSKDVDSMMSSHNMSPTQYLTAAAEKTKSPVLEYFVRGINKICDMYKEDAFVKYNDALNNDIKMTTPPAPDLSDGNINKHLIDLEDDLQAQDVLTAIEDQTKSQIVNNISNLLINKKQEDDMEFDPEPNDSLGMDVEESAISVGMDFINRYMMMNESAVTVDNDMYEEFLGLCIRESTLNEIDKCLEMASNYSITDYKYTIRSGNGTIVNEMSIDEVVNG